MKCTFVLLSIILSLGLVATSCAKDSIGGGASDTSGDGEMEDESGKIWNINDLAGEVVDGIRLIMHYDAAQNAFIGSIENTNTTTVSKVRVEIHIFDSSENRIVLGPTTPVDMVTGDVRSVILTAPQSMTIVTFSMHLFVD